MKRPYRLADATVRFLIETARAGGSAAISHELEDKLERHLEAEREELAEAKRLREVRAHRAANATLTRRQAEALLAVYHGMNPSQRLGRVLTYEDGRKVVRFHHGRSTGGAIRRMLDRLIDEGLLTDRRLLTLGGLSRLDQWQAKNGKLIPDGVEVIG